MLAPSHNPAVIDLGLRGPAPEGWPPDGWQAQKHLAGSTRYDLELCTVNLRVAGPGQAFLVAPASWGADAASAARAAYSEIGRVLQDQGLTIVHERLFGSISVKSAVLAARDAAFRARNLPANGPITYVQGHPPWGEGLAGIIIRAVSRRYPQDKVWTIRDQGQPVGRGWRQGDATFLVLQNLQGLALNGNGANGPPQQARRMIQRAAQSSRAKGPPTGMWRGPGSTCTTFWPGTRSSTRPAVRCTGNLASCP